MSHLTLIRTSLLAGAAVAALASPAAAADVTPAQAASLERQVRDALGALVGPSVKLADRPVHITPAGDHYDVVVMSGYKTTAAPGAPAQDIQLTATARQDDKGIWLIEGLRLPSPLRFTVDVPLPPTNGQRPGSAGTGPVTYTMEQVAPVNRIVWDPTFATPSTSTSSSQSTSVRAEGAVTQTSQIGHVNSVTTLRPVGTDRADILLDGTMEDYRVSSTSSSGPIDVGMKRLRVGMALNGVSRARSVTILQASASVIAAALQAPPTPPGTPRTAPKVAPELVRSVLAALQDFASDFTLDETIDGFIVKAQDQTVAMDQMKLGIDAKSDSGLLRAGMTLAVQGIALPDIPLGDMAALIPTRIALHPVVGGIGVAELMRMAQAGSDHKDPAPADIQAMFSHGGITAGLQSLAVDVAGASLTGQAQFVATGPSPDMVSGTALLTVENFDALVQKVSAMPALAQQAVPIMVFVKGIGRTVGTQLVYDISYKDGKILINNVDLTAMAGGPAPAPRPPAQLAPPPVPAPSPVPVPTPGGALKAPARPLPSWAK